MAKVPERIAAEREAWRRAKATREGTASAHRVVAADGKTLKGSGSNRWTRTHLVALLDPESCRVTGRITVDGKMNEAPALRAHVRTIEIDETVLTADTAHTCRVTAQVIVDGGGHYLLIVKRNTCATRRFDTSPLEAGATRREVGWV